MTPAASTTFEIPTFETERLTLRAPRMSDYPTWQAFFASDRAEFIGGPGDVRTAWRGFAHVVGMWPLRGFGSFVFSLKNSDAPIGMTGPWFPMDWPERELGWTVWNKDAEGTGLAFEAASAARSYAYGVLGWDTAVSYIDPRNARSIALAERLGCVRDDDAPQPASDAPNLVYRHPDPEALA